MEGEMKVLAALAIFTIFIVGIVEFDKYLDLRKETKKPWPFAEEGWKGDR